MPDQPHSKTVRGTLSNPKTQAAIKNNETPPGIGDPAAQVEPKESSSTSSPGSVPSNSAPSAPGTAPQSTVEQNKKKLPHSKTVRGTLANTDGKNVDTKMLGDPVSLKAETSERGLGKGAGEGGKSKL